MNFIQIGNISFYGNFSSLIKIGTDTPTKIVHPDLTSSIFLLIKHLIGLKRVLITSPKGSQLEIDFEQTFPFLETILSTLAYFSSHSYTNSYVQTLEEERLKELEEEEENIHN